MPRYLVLDPRTTFVATTFASWFLAATGCSLEPESLHCNPDYAVDFSTASDFAGTWIAASVNSFALVFDEDGTPTTIQYDPGPIDQSSGELRKNPGGGGSPNIWFGCKHTSDYPLVLDDPNIDRHRFGEPLDAQILRRAEITAGRIELEYELSHLFELYKFELLGDGMLTQGRWSASDPERLERDEPPDVVFEYLPPNAESDDADRTRH